MDSRSCEARGWTKNLGGGRRWQFRDTFAQLQTARRKSVDERTRTLRANFFELPFEPQAIFLQFLTVDGREKWVCSGH